MAEANLLREPILGVRSPSGLVQLHTLPQVFADLAAGQVEDFSGLQIHQSHAWYTFLVQLGAIALHHAGRALPPVTSDDWLGMLRDLTAGKEEPWCLFVTDLSCPAFLQPPVPEGTLQNFSKRLEQADLLDVLITAKNHDVKQARIQYPRLEHWVYAMLNLQTMEGYSGKYNYGISRMNGGYGSRPFVGIAQSVVWGARWKRDISVLLNNHALLSSQYGYPVQGGKVLLWLEPWDGRNSLSIQQCAPFFIEICRRVRLVRQGEAICAYTSSTETSRIEAKHLNGVTGDPWTPIERGQKALTVSSAGFGYRQVYQLLFNPDWTLGVAGQLSKNDISENNYLFQVLVRGQGETNGYHERLLPLPRHIPRILRVAEERNRLGQQAKRYVEAVNRAQRSVLHPAICLLIQGAPDKLNLKDNRTQPWLNAMDAEVDRIFFPSLWKSANETNEGADQQWAKELYRIGCVQLEDAIQRVSIATSRRPRAVARAELMFGAAFRKHIPAFSIPEASEG